MSELDEQMKMAMFPLQRTMRIRELNAQFLREHSEWTEDQRYEAIIEQLEKEGYGEKG